MKLSELEELIKWLKNEYGDIEIKSYNKEKAEDEEISQRNFSWSPIHRPKKKPFIRMWV